MYIRRQKGHLFKGKFVLYFILALSFLSFLSCSGHSSMEHQHQATSKPGSPDPETLAMIDSVQKAQNGVDPMKVMVMMTKERAQL